ncbi:unnamed protein product [Spirodela intermedia]|uniref:SUI1 domain-containing protein n=1 Tax=Spirodela intermedia TaxID=51605 RepID=A0A7I8JSP2_SPIIN|nr:unnamed protein product [Spirodela intermedia]CAA6673188.1 unnamed protein product [Spirodela intermedia]
MFKKSAEAKSLQRLSGADRKKLRRTMKERFPQASDTDVDIIFPAKAEVTVMKFPNRAHVYGVEGGFPMLFDIDGRGSEIFPTGSPSLAFIRTKRGEVSRYVLGGADLMFPGISIPPEGLPSFLEGQPWAVKVPGNPAPIAVGTTTMSSAQAMKAGLRGKALRITHYYRDSLWESAEGHYVPNAGFFEDIVVEDPASSSMCQPSEGAQHDAVRSEEGPEGVEASEIPPGDVDSSAQPALGDGASDDVSSNLSGLNISDGTSAEVVANDDKDQRNLSSAEVDALLDRCLLQALHTSLKDKDLPMPGSTLWYFSLGHVGSRSAVQAPGSTLDIKKSSYKKLSKWLQSKSSAGLISAKEDKHKKEIILLSVNRAHSEYQSFRPEKKREPEAGRPNSDSSAGQGPHGAAVQLDVVEVYKPTSHVNPIFAAVGVDTGRFYTAPRPPTYVEEGRLAKPSDKSMVVLDATLCDALYKGAIKKGSSYPTEVHKREVGPAFLGRMQVHHLVTRGAESTVRKGAVRAVQIMTEWRQGNKKVTRLSGLETFLLDADALAAELQKKFACSTTVSELPGKKGQNEVLVQGGVIEDLARHLVDHYGIPKRFIEVLDKTKR